MEYIANFTWALTTVLSIGFIISLIAIAKKPEHYTKEKEPFE